MVMLLCFGLLALGALGQGDVSPPTTQPAESAGGPVAATDGEEASGVVIRITGEINNVTLMLIERGMEKAREAGADTVVFELDTPGGLVVSALEICRYLKELEEPTVAWVRPMAYSAGAMISVACDRIVMSPRSSIGDCAPIVPGGKLEGRELEKVESPIREEFRDSAKRHGYPLVLCEAMVRPGEPVYKLKNTATGEARFARAYDLVRFGLTEDDYRAPLVGAPPQPAREESSDAEGAETSDLPVTDWRIEKRVLGEDRLLTMSQDEAVEYQFADTIVADEEALADYLGIPQGRLMRIELSWSERLAIWLSSSSVRGALVVVFLLAGYLELQSPGLGLPGGLALIALAALIGAPYLAGMADVLEIILILAGGALIIVEIFIIPGFGVAGVAGMILVFAGFAMSFVPPEPGPDIIPKLPATWDAMRRGLFTLVISLAVSMVGLFFLVRYFGALPILNRLVLQSGTSDSDAGARADAKATRRFTPPGEPSAAPQAPPSPDAGPAVGDSGRLVTDLRPAGRARIDGNLVDVVTRGEWIEAGREVRIVDVRGNRIVVEGA